MIDRNQFISSRAQEIGVSLCHLDAELYFVDDSLSGAVIGGKKLKIFQSIIESVSRNVMNSFFGKQFSANVLLHVVTVFENFMAGLAISRGDTEHDVVSFDSAAYLRTSVFFAVNLAYPLVLALSAAKFLLGVDGAGTIATSFVELFAAIFAIGLVFFVGCFSTAERRTGHRAIHRVFIELLSVFLEIGRFVEKRLAAFLTGKFGFRRQRGDSTVDIFVSRNTSLRAESLFSVARLYGKIRTALFASFNDRHGFISYVGFPSGSLVR